MFQATPLYGMPDGSVVPGLIRPVLQPDDTDEIYVITQGTANRLESVAQFLYGNPEIWWALAQLNAVVDPWTDLPQDYRLRVPSRDRLRAAKIIAS